MPLTERERLNILSQLDQEESEIREMLECEEYRVILTDLLGRNITSLMEAVKDPDSNPDTPCIFTWGLIDGLTVVRMAQAYLVGHILKEEEDDAL